MDADENIIERNRTTITMRHHSYASNIKLQKSDDEFKMSHGIVQYSHVASFYYNDNNNNKSLKIKKCVITQNGRKDGKSRRSK